MPLGATWTGCPTTSAAGIAWARAAAGKAIRAVSPIAARATSQVFITLIPPPLMRLSILGLRLRRAHRVVVVMPDQEIDQRRRGKRSKREIQRVQAKAARRFDRRDRNGSRRT